MKQRIVQLSIVGVWFAALVLTDRFPFGLWWWCAFGAVVDACLIAWYARSAHTRQSAPYLAWFLGAYASLVWYMFIDRAVLRAVWMLVLTLASLLYWYRIGKWSRMRAFNEAPLARVGSLWFALAVWAMGTVVYGWQIFVRVNMYGAGVLVAALVALATWNVWKLASLASVERMRVHTLIITLLAIEFFWVIGFTSFGFMTKGFLWASSVWYGWWLGALIQKDAVAPVRVTRGTLITLASWCVTLFTVRWI